MSTPEMVKVNSETETSPENSYRYHLAQSALICGYRSLYSCDECRYSCMYTHTHICRAAEHSMNECLPLARAA